ncbi:NVEALA domain-containing protein [Bacteroides bouchesdurhonensis]
MKNKILYGILGLAIAIITTINAKDNLNIERLSNISMANIEALAAGEGETVSCSISLSCYNKYGNLTRTITCNSSTGDCTSGTEGIFKTEYIKCEGIKYTC